MTTSDPSKHIAKTRIDATAWEPSPLPPETIIAGDPAPEVHWLRESRDPDAPYLAGLWRAQPSTFDYFFTMNETAHILEGNVVVTQKEGPTLDLWPGDVVTFPRGAMTRWEVRGPLKKVFVNTP